MSHTFIWRTTGSLIRICKYLLKNQYYYQHAYKTVYVERKIEPSFLALMIVTRFVLISIFFSSFLEPWTYWWPRLYKQRETTWNLWSLSSIITCPDCWGMTYHLHSGVRGTWCLATWSTSTPSTAETSSPNWNDVSHHIKSVTSSWNTWVLL